MSMTKEALQYVVGLGKTEVMEVNGQSYATSELYRVKGLQPAAIKATTLTALVDYIKSGMDKKFSEKLLIHVVSPNTVVLLSELRGDMAREAYMECNALLPSINLGSFMEVEKFNIMLQSTFVAGEDKEIVLRVVGNVTDNVVKDTSDDGVSQAVTIKTGLAQKGYVLVPNPAQLATYRSFPEIEQVASKFVFRMRQGRDNPEAALFEADGGAWRNEAMFRIKDYLTQELEGIENIEVVC
ncbi:hypothetical protein CS063_01410 [Sporanaerobium hydrogeniformans]|uniref:Uncharacterized protein n=1 Tax=Sporanaerobium hydrogeniformans TaxID=3072179 RepID=A0AC61DH47_9FIRM|nr:hypothetical protein [Sporanaerobium hydrogeniformans]PHV72160.1 hypothetical protein CS063_01410 [Sporanaerobium hydrogeniformans]